MPRLEDDETSDEEAELEGIRRPKFGEGWWGRGPTLQPHRKGHVKQFVDGAGFPSPGRWPLERRQLPDDELAKELKKIVTQGLRNSVEHLPGKSIKTAVLKLAAGGCESSPFPVKILVRVRADIRITLAKAGFGDGFSTGRCCTVGLSRSRSLACSLSFSSASAAHLDSSHSSRLEAGRQSAQEDTACPIP